MTALCTELQVDKEFAGLCPELTAEEADLLEASLTGEGCRDPIVIWANHDDTILDGHNRYRICRRFGVSFKVKALKLETREDAIKWIASNQLGRRNLTDEQKSYLRGKRYLAEKKAEHDGGAGQERSGDHNDPHLKTADRLSKELNVSSPTIKRDAKFARALDKIEKEAGPDAKQKIISGQCKLGKAAVIEAAELPPRKMARAIERGELPVQNKSVSDAMRYAAMAIAQLERIAEDDPERRAALDKVWNWLKTRRT